jgi:hypothetical protein
MQRFWDRRAGENAFFVVDNRIEYREPHERRFWEDGECELAAVLDALEEQVRPRDVVVEIGGGVRRRTRPLAGLAERHHPLGQAVTLGYVREVGPVLRPGGWAAFQVSNDPAVHRRRLGRADLAARMRALGRRAPRGQDHPDWRGSYIDLGDLLVAARAAGMQLEGVFGEGTQFCLVRLRRAARE